MTLGELLVDFIATEAGVQAGESEFWRAAPGGAPANVAVGAARLGVATSFLGKVGDDPFGHMLARTLAAEGVDTRGLRFDPNARTALAFVSLTEDGERSFHFFRHPSADMLFRPDEVDLEQLRLARVLHFGSISLIGEPSRGATLRAVEVAREAGLLVTFDPNLRIDLWPGEAQARRTILEGLRLAHVAKLSEEELEFLAGGRELGCAADLARELELLVVTRGAEGADFLTPALSGRVAGFETHAVDTTGAGDSFMATLIAGLVEEPQLPALPAELERVIRRANACAAITVSGPGAIPSLPTTEQVEEFLARQPAGK